MKTINELKTIKDLIALFSNKLLYANPEYQRGLVWTELQKKKLIDSIFRGYPLPLIYLHHKKRTIAGIIKEDFEVIDGQQRLNTLYEFSKDAFKLLDPVKDASKAKFPNFIVKQSCSWANKDFSNLDSEYQKLFLDTELNVRFIYTDEDNEARDLFVRLQAGSPLNAQERRDAWPGQFTEFILKTGGKPEISIYPGNDIFKNFLSIGGNDRGKRRTLCAQTAMLFLEKNSFINWLNIGSDDIDEYYYKNIDFNKDDKRVERFIDILKLIYELLNDGKRDKLKGHELIHTVLLIDSLLDNYTNDWKTRFANSFDRFRKELGLQRLAMNRNADSNNLGEYILNYYIYTTSQADNANSLRKRHTFFSNKMMEFLQPKPLDNNRSYNQLEREIIYYRDNKKCFYCNEEINWFDLEIHHENQYQHGGQTTLENGKAVHKICHHNGIH